MSSTKRAASRFSSPSNEELETKKPKSDTAEMAVQVYQTVLTLRAENDRVETLGKADSYVKVYTTEPHSWSIPSAAMDTGATSSRLSATTPPAAMAVSTGLSGHTEEADAGAMTPLRLPTTISMPVRLASHMGDASTGTGVTSSRFPAATSASAAAVSTGTGGHTEENDTGDTTSSRLSTANAASETTGAYLQFYRWDVEARFTCDLQYPAFEPINVKLQETCNIFFEEPTEIAVYFENPESRYDHEAIYDDNGHRLLIGYVFYKGGDHSSFLPTWTKDYLKKVVGDEKPVLSAVEKENILKAYEGSFMEYGMEEEGDGEDEDEEEKKEGEEEEEGEVEEGEKEDGKEAKMQDDGEEEDGEGSGDGYGFNSDTEGPILLVRSL